MDPELSRDSIGQESSVMASSGVKLFSGVGRLHPSSIVFEATAQIRQFIVPVGLGLAGAASGNLWSLWIAVPVLLVTLIFNLVRYFTLRYQIEDRELVVTEGLLFRRIRSVPIRRIQNIDYVQNLFHRALDVAVVKVETASGDKPEATLRVIKMEQVEQLRQAVFRADHASSSPAFSPVGQAGMAGLASEHDGEVVAAVSSSGLSNQPGEELWRITPWMLFIAGVTSNRGMVLIGIVAGYFFQSDWRGPWSRENFRVSRDQIRGYLPEQIQVYGATLQIVLIALLVLVVLRIVSIVWYFLRFYGYTLSLHGEDLRISCGLFTRVSATVPRERIQFISIHSPVFMRPFGLASIRIETAGGAGSEGEDAAATVSRRWFVPVIRYERAIELLVKLRPTIQWDPPTIPWQGLSPRAPARVTRLAVVMSALIAGIGLAVTRPWGWAVGGAVLPLFVLVGRKKARARRYARLPWGMVFQSGLLTRKLSLTFADRVQAADCAQSWFDRRWQMATLSIDTAAAGPANHTFEIHYLDEQFAQEEFRSLIYEAARHRPEFG